jgi:hypothetical protein
MALFYLVTARTETHPIVPVLAFRELVPHWGVLRSPCNSYTSARSISGASSRRRRQELLRRYDLSLFESSASQCPLRRSQASEPGGGGRTPRRLSYGRRSPWYSLRCPSRESRRSCGPTRAPSTRYHRPSGQLPEILGSAATLRVLCRYAHGLGELFHDLLVALGHGHLLRALPSRASYPLLRRILRSLSIVRWLFAEIPTTTCTWANGRLRRPSPSPSA